MVWSGSRPSTARKEGPVTTTTPSRPPGRPKGTTQTIGAELPTYLRTAEVADILHVSPKTVSRWAKEGKLPFLKTLGGHRRYPEAKVRELAAGLVEEITNHSRGGYDRNP
jgi:excisionase family DNA binding protein